MNSSFFAQNENKVIISSKKEIYAYVSDKKGEVRLKTEYIAHYKCLKPETVSVVEFYDNYSEIEHVRIKGIKGVKPRYGMYRQENVFFSDSKACSFNIPFTEKGTEAVVTMSKTYKDIRRFSYLMIAEPYYISSKTIEISVPDWMNVTLLLKNASENIRKDSVRDEANKTTIHVFNIADQPEVIMEPHSVNYKRSHPYILVVPKESTANGENIKYFETIDHLYQWYKDPLASLTYDTQAIREKSSELTTHCTTEEEKIRELCKWVQQNIRYIAFQDGISAFRPDEAQEVIRKKYGDCKGMSNLLKSLLISSGFDARLAWVSTDTDGEEDLDVDAPVPFADHMICSLFWNDSLYYIDPTVKSLSFGEIPEYVQGRKALIENGENYIVSRIPGYDSTNNKDSLYLRCSIVENSLKGEAYRYFKGESKQGVLYWMNSLKESDKQHMIEAFLKNGETQDEVSAVVTEGLEAFLPEIFIRYRVDRKSTMNISGNQIYINLDDCKDYQHAKIDISKRKTALRFPYKDCVIRVSEFSIPEGFHLVQHPQKVEVTRKKYSFVLSYKREGNKLVYQKKIIIFDPVLEKDEFGQWNADIDILRKSYSELIVLESEIK